MIKSLIIYLLLINIIGFTLMGIDKRKAIRNAYRISEASLFLPTILGGALGSLLGMYYYRHKTRKRKFVFGIPFLMILELSIFIFFYIIK